MPTERSASCTRHETPMAGSTRGPRDRRRPPGMRRGRRRLSSHNAFRAISRGDHHPRNTIPRLHVRRPRDVHGVILSRGVQAMQPGIDTWGARCSRQVFGSDQAVSRRGAADSYRRGSALRPGAERHRWLPASRRGRSRRSRCSGTGCRRADPDLLLGRIRVRPQQRRRRDEHAGRAEAALHSAVLEERALQRRQLPVAASPSTVVISRPSACRARYEQEFTGSPSSSIMQAPHSESSQPSLEPVRPRCSRTARSRLVCGSISTGYASR